jgi:hypothetical protein
VICIHYCRDCLLPKVVAVCETAGGGVTSHTSGVSVHTDIGCLEKPLLELEALLTEHGSAEAVCSHLETTYAAEMI